MNIHSLTGPTIGIGMLDVDNLTWWYVYFVSKFIRRNNERLFSLLQQLRAEHHSNNVKRPSSAM
jgi:hypothetical protein